MLELNKYSFVVSPGKDILELEDKTGKRYTFKMSHECFVRFSRNMETLAMDSTYRADFLAEEEREN